MPEKGFHILTFGCQMNVRDTQWLAATLKGRGFVETDAASADVILLNTCSVREKPEHKVRSALQRLAIQSSPGAFLGVMGCVAQQLGTELLKISPAVRLVVGTDAIWEAPDAIENLFREPERRIVLLEFQPVYKERAEDCQAGIHSFVNIMQGCDNFCSYCIVPFTRGRQKSRLRSHVLAECKKRINEGALEIMLLGQNVNAWGKDLGETGFNGLLKIIGSLPGLKRLRFITPHPADMDQAAVDCFAQLGVLCPRLHLPLQSGSSRILKAMRRRYDAEQYLRLVQRLREARPDIVLTTDLIVGFPGETEEDFCETLALVNEIAFAGSFSFCYSDRPGTIASSMVNKIPLEESRERLARLQSLQEKLTASHLQGRVGDTVEIFIEGPGKRGGNFWQGRDIYGDIINVELPGKPVAPVLQVRIIEAKKHTLLGRPV